jgi:urease beta subunit
MGSVDVVDQTKDRSTKTVTVTNTGDLPLKVDQAYIAGVDAQSFTVSRSTCDNTTVPVGGTCQADVTFDPSNTGTTTASLNFADDANMIGFQNIPLKGVGIAGKATPSVTTLAFNTVTAGSPLTKTLTVTNTGDAPLDVTPSITGTASADFSIVAAQTTCAQLAPGATCTIAVQFDPQAIGSRTAALEIPNDTGVNSRVALTGTGAGSVFTVGPNPVTFGNVTRGTTKTQTVTVKNSGSLAFTVTSARVTSPDSAVVSAYTVTGAGCVGTVLAPGKTCNISVTLKPVTARFYTATLEVAGDKTTLPRPGVVKTTLNATGV